MKQVLGSIKEKQNEARYLQEVLELWDACPYPPSEVRAFSWNHEFLPDKRRWIVATQKYTGPGPCDFHNAVRMNTGELREMPLTPRPRR